VPELGVGWTLNATVRNVVQSHASLTTQRSPFKKHTPALISRVGLDCDFWSSAISAKFSFIAFRG